MSRDIYGDEFKEEIRKLKKLDERILKCKAQAERIRYICKTDPALNGIDTTLHESIRTLLKLSKNLNNLTDALSDYEELRDTVGSWVLSLVGSNKDDKSNFERMKKLRSGAEKLTKTYDETISMFAKAYREERKCNE
jgi:hypothetical protein